MPKLLRTLVALVAACLVGACGGNDEPAATAVALCVQDLKPALLACLPPDYRGVDTTSFSACLRADAALAAKVTECRALDPQEFRAEMDHVVGHAASYALSRL